MLVFSENDRIDLCFNNDNPETNGEKNLIQNLLNDLVVFDVGCRSDSEILMYKGDVHYFDPIPEFIDAIRSKENKNTRSTFNKFGLSSQDATFDYYPRYQSFYNRVNSCQIDDTANKITVDVKKAKNYMLENNITHVDFLKIDVEGHEPDVIFGFEDEIKKVKVIQFEYGGTYKDNGSSLSKIVEHLSRMGFANFGYLNYFGFVRMTDLVDHYNYCNVICFNESTFNTNR